MTSANDTTNLLYGQYVITAGRVYLAEVDCHFISCGDVREPRYIVSVDLLNPATGETLADVEAMAFDPISRKPAEDHLAHLIATYGTAPVDPAPAAIDTGRAHGPSLRALLQGAAEEKNAADVARRHDPVAGDWTPATEAAYRAAEARYDALYRLGSTCAAVVATIEPTPAAIIDAAAQSLGRELTTREACALFAEPAHTHDLSRPATLPQLMACPACCAPQPGDIEWSLD